jgi:predicted 3-demethylubiquinone-9 3-methyltransferase (glyoxalase superfamily)
MQQKITPNLWFDGNAKEAVDYYVSVFPNSAVTSTEYYPKTAEEGLADFQLDMAGKELVIQFELNGQAFAAINAWPQLASRAKKHGRTHAAAKRLRQYDENAQNRHRRFLGLTDFSGRICPT